MTTIYDVAARAGVSPATVSRVFSGAGVKPDKVQAVRTAARELGFVPNPNARRLRTRSSELIAMMIPDIENTFYTTMTKAVEDVARSQGYSIILCSTDDDPEREASYVKAVVAEQVAGIIIAPTASAPLSLAEDRGVPVVCVDRTRPGSSADSVVTDNRSSADHATDLLYQAGYRRVGCLTGRPGIETADERALGWADRVRATAGADPADGLLRREPYTIEGGEAGMRALLALPTDQRPDAVFAANNKLAIGALRVLIEQELMPPAIGVASLGELPLLTLTPREVVVTHLPARELGTVAATMLLERIRGSVLPPRHIVVPSVTTDDQAALATIADLR